MSAASRAALRKRWTAEQQTIRSELTFDDAASTFAVTITPVPTSNAHANLHDEYNHPVVRLERAPDIVVQGLKTIGGVDISFLPPDPFQPWSSLISNAKESQEGVATVVVLAFPSLELLHTRSSRIKLAQPYISSFLAFREAPPLLDLFAELKKELEGKGKLDEFPELLFVDGNGRLHERECGLACVLGLRLGIPTIGISKKPYIFPSQTSTSPNWRSSPNPFCSTLRMRLLERGAWLGLFPPPTAPITSSDLPSEATKSSSSSFPYLGAALLPSSTSLAPIFVSPGHLISLETSVRLTVVCSKTKIPEAVRRADLEGREEVRRWVLEKERAEKA